MTLTSDIKLNCNKHVRIFESENGVEETHYNLLILPPHGHSQRT
jgi:hypothetical protein